jgi:chitodextrinase
MWKAASTSIRSGRVCLILTVALVTATLAPTAAAADRKPPTAPSQLALTRATSNSLSVSWRASRDPGGRVAGYRVYLNAVRVAVTSQTSYTFGSLACGTSYTVGVDAFDSAGNTSARTSVVVSTSACADTAAPTPPSGLAQTGATRTTIALSWTASADNVGVTGYAVYRDGAAAGSTASTSYAFASLVCGRSYTLGVEALDAAGNRSSRTSVTASTGPCPDTLAPTAPGYLTQTAAAADSISLSWGSSFDDVGVAGYGVYVNGALRATTPLTTFKVLSLSCGTTYTLAVDAYDAAGNRSARATVSAATGACSGDPSSAVATIFLPTADARVEQAYPSTNFGNAHLRTDGGGDPLTETNLRFNVAGISGTVTRATLRLYATSDTVDGPTLHAATTSWSESSVTWSTRPAYTADSMADSVAISTGAWVEYDVTPVFTGTGTYGFALRGSSSDGVDFDSREGARPPQLVVTTVGGSADTQPPSAPSGLAKTAATPAEVSVSWNASSDNVSVAGYGVYVNGTKVGSTPKTSYTASTLACGTSYTVAVDAYDTSGNRSAKTSIAASTNACAASSSPPPPPPPPPPTGSCGWGTFSSTLQVWPGGCWRPFADTSPWNKPIPASPTLRSNSAAVVSRLTTGPGDLSAGQPASEDWYHPIVYSRPTDPLYTIHCNIYTCDDLEGKQVRIPAGAKPAGATDKHLSVVDQSTGYAYDFWQANTPSGSGGTLNVGDGGVSRVVEPNATGASLDLDGDGRFGASTAPGFSNLAGIIRAQELAAGQINHALFLTIPCASSGLRMVPPAVMSASNFCSDDVDRLPFGARLQLGMSEAEVNALAVPAWKKAILHALRVYGGYFSDTGGPSAFGVILESEASYTAFGLPGEMTEFAAANGWTPYSGYYVGNLRTGVPWNRLRVLDWNDPANR